MAASALKKILRERPTADDLSRRVGELETDGHRGCAALGSALLEDLLRLVLISKMRSLSKDEHDRLFVGSGPLVSLSVKTQMAAAFKFIGPKIEHDINTIREIRNAIVHTNLKIDFDTEEVANLCGGLHVLSLVNSFVIPDPVDTPRAKFAAAIKILMLHLISKFADDDDSSTRPIRDFDPP